MGAKLLVSFQGAEFAFDLRGDGVKVGSAPTNGLVLKDPAVSREHAEVRRIAGAWRLLDLESASGTRVNGLYVNKQDLKTGDVIALGSARLTFQGDDSVAPAPLPGMAAVPVPAPAPLAAAPAPVPLAAVPVRAAQAPAHAPPPVASYEPPPPSRRQREREEKPRRPGRAGGSRGGGGSGGLIGMGIFVVVVIGVIVAWNKFGGNRFAPDPNQALLAQIRDLQKQGKWEEIVALEPQADRGNPFTLRDVNIEIADARTALAARKNAADQAEIDRVYQQEILPFRDSRSTDDKAVVARCDDFLRRWPNHEKAPEVARIRLQIAGEPSPVWQEMHGGGGPGSGAFVSYSDIEIAADREVARCVSDDDYAGAYRVLERYVASGARTVLPEFLEQFKSDIAKKRKKLDKEEHDAFEKLEEKALSMEDHQHRDEEEALYRVARSKYGSADILARCDAEIERLHGKR